MKLNLKPVYLVSALFLAACSTKPTVNNYNTYMNTPEVKSGSASSIDGQLANKPGWNAIKVTEMSLHRTLPDGSYATDATHGVLTVRANLINSGDTPVQGNWRCIFFDSNNLPLYETQSNQVTTEAQGLGWHLMVVYPLSAKSRTYDANVINCKAADPLATNYRVEFHDTANDITVYKH
jgi:hypothetical protein